MNRLRPLVGQKVSIVQRHQGSALSAAGRSAGDRIQLPTENEVDAKHLF